VRCASSTEVAPSSSAAGVMTSRTSVRGISALAGADIAPVVLDGEIVALPNGEPSFEALQGVMRRRVGSRT
jgi:ATP-dependent DNA ligase